MISRFNSVRSEEHHDLQAHASDTEEQTAKTRFEHDRLLHVHSSQGSLKPACLISRQEQPCEAPLPDKAQSIFSANTPSRNRTEAREQKIFYLAPNHNSDSVIPQISGRWISFRLWTEFYPLLSKSEDTLLKLGGVEGWGEGGGVASRASSLHLFGLEAGVWSVMMAAGTKRCLKWFVLQGKVLLSCRRLLGHRCVSLLPLDWYLQAVLDHSKHIGANFSFLPIHQFENPSWLTPQSRHEASPAHHLKESGAITDSSSMHALTCSRVLHTIEIGASSRAFVQPLLHMINV